MAERPPNYYNRNKKNRKRERKRQNITENKDDVSQHPINNKNYIPCPVCRTITDKRDIQGPCGHGTHTACNMCWNSKNICSLITITEKKYEQCVRCNKILHTSMLNKCSCIYQTHRTCRQCYLYNNCSSRIWSVETCRICHKNVPENSIIHALIHNPLARLFGCIECIQKKLPNSVICEICNSIVSKEYINKDLVGITNICGRCYVYVDSLDRGYCDPNSPNRCKDCHRPGTISCTICSNKLCITCIKMHMEKHSVAPRCVSCNTTENIDTCECLNHPICLSCIKNNRKCPSDLIFCYGNCKGHTNRSDSYPCAKCNIHLCSSCWENGCTCPDHKTGHRNRYMPIGMQNIGTSSPMYSLSDNEMFRSIIGGLGMLAVGALDMATRNGRINRPPTPPNNAPSTALCNFDSDNNDIRMDSKDNKIPEKGSLCSVCLDRQINCVLLECGHLTTCFECASRIYKSNKPECPICREKISRVIKTFVASVETEKKIHVDEIQDKREETKKEEKTA